MENNLKLFIHEIWARILYSRSEEDATQLKNYWEEIVMKQPPFPKILTFNDPQFKAYCTWKTEELYEVTPSNRAHLISIMTAAQLLYQEIKKMPEISSIPLPVNTSTISVKTNTKNNPNCTCTCTCIKCTKSYNCQFCNKQFQSKDGRNNHKNYFCKSNPNPKPKKIKKKPIKRLQSKIQK